MCHENESWTRSLPIILLGLRTIWRADFEATPAELLYGESFRLPCDFFEDTLLKPCFSDNSSETDIESSIGEDTPNKPAKMPEKKIRFAPLPLPASTRATRGRRQVRLPVRYIFVTVSHLGGVLWRHITKTIFALRRRIKTTQLLM
ncbi:uncharacterized protein TNIN_17641 [Trichonephila inaurata madagascariensis]|uniref:Uncharacterized protein n=1 Tax=Trichonephila inaurata madagascariensis TaxID=2747483 RepID=A0A8X6YFJ6_9ARAC|nr:uncharacterized protein TNIN_17641 [Trichonephila inaurata madagascariensis]